MYGTAARKVRSGSKLLGADATYMGIDALLCSTRKRTSATLACAQKSIFVVRSVAFQFQNFILLRSHKANTRAKTWRVKDTSSLHATGRREGNAAFRSYLTTSLQSVTAILAVQKIERQSDRGHPARVASLHIVGRELRERIRRRFFKSRQPTAEHKLTLSVGPLRCFATQFPPDRAPRRKIHLSPVGR